MPYRGNTESRAESDEINLQNFIVGECSRVSAEVQWFACDWAGGFAAPPNQLNHPCDSGGDQAEKTNLGQSFREVGKYGLGRRTFIFRAIHRGHYIPIAMAGLDGDITI